MAKTFDTLKKKYTDEDLDRARARLRDELAEHEAGLADVRKARGLTQIQLARALGVTQAQVSRIENQTDLYLSTLASYVDALGGELELIATFNRTQVRLTVDALEALEEDYGADLAAALRTPEKRAAALARAGATVAEHEPAS